MFTDHEILCQLKTLGFANVTDEQLRALRTELDAAVGQDQSIYTNGSSPKPTSSKSVSEQAVVITNAYKNDRESPVFSHSKHVKVEKFSPILPSRRISKENCSAEERAESRASAFSGSTEIGTLSQCSEKSGLSWTTSSSSLGCPHKRKVLRVRNGVPVVCHERMANSGASETSTISVESHGRKLRQLADRNDWSPPSPAGSGAENAKAWAKSGSRFKQVSKKWRSVGDLSKCGSQTLYKPKSVILPYTDQPQAHQFFKTDPVALYHFYRKEWSSHKVPGEKEHKQLRWNIRTRMAHRDEPTVSANGRNTRTGSRLSVFSN